VFLGDNLVSWFSKRQNIVSRSSAEAEYRAVANSVAEACWLRQLLVELHNPLLRATLVYCDNASAVYLSTNPVQHQRTKHVEIDLHFIRERVAVEEVCVLHVPTTSQFTDISTKGLPSSVFSEFRPGGGGLEDSCIGGLLGCVCIGLFALVWGEAHLLGYIIVILLLESIKHSFTLI
jgi:hypothetical protein